MHLLAPEASPICPWHARIVVCSSVSPPVSLRDTGKEWWLSWLQRPLGCVVAVWPPGPWASPSPCIVVAPWGKLARAPGSPLETRPGVVTQARAVLGGGLRVGGSGAPEHRSDPPKVPQPRGRFLPLCWLS